ncbi:MAG: DUF2254 family protein, partial [Saprospiraceae bacterium]
MQDLRLTIMPMLDMYTLRKEWQRYWVICLYVSIVAVISILIALSLQHLPDTQLNASLDGFIGFAGNAFIAILTTTFSAILVALTLGSAQFSPRIIRAFFREDKANQALFYIFLIGVALTSTTNSLDIHFGTWMYRSCSIYKILVAFFSYSLLTIIFPYFVFRIINSINAASITKRICSQTLSEIEKLYENDTAAIQQPRRKATIPPGVHPIASQQYGFLNDINFEKLSKLVRTDPDMQWYIVPIVGNFIAQHSPLLYSDKELDSQKQQLIRTCFDIHRFRSYNQDINFGVRQLVDIAIKAISPAVNDPTTALNCINYLGEILKGFVNRKEVAKKGKKFAHQQIHIREFNFDMLLDLSFDQIVQWGRNDHVVIRGVLETLTEVVTITRHAPKLFTIANSVRDMELFNSHTQRVDRFATAEFNAAIVHALRRFWEAIEAAVQRTHQPDELRQVTAQATVLLPLLRQQLATYKQQL